MGRTPLRARGRALALGIFAAAALLLAAGPASASTLSLDGGTLVYTASAGETNLVSIKLQSAGDGPNGIDITDRDSSDPTASVPITNNAPTHCVGGGSEVLCQADGISSIRVDLSDMNDTVGFTNIALPVTIFGGDGADTLNTTDAGSSVDGGAGNDTIAGGTGNDTLLGGAGDDKVHGGEGNDVVDGGDGKDTLFGEGGADSLHGGAAADALDGGAGDDTLDGGLAGDDLHGGAGRDTVSYADRLKPVTVDMNANADDGEPNENDNVENDVEVVIGGAADDRLGGRDCGTDTSSAQASGTTGSSGVGSAGMQAPAPSCDDTFDGGPGDDTLIGRGGNDILRGGDGADQLDGGTGADVLSGGAGEDNVTYAGRSNGVNVTLDGKADDGESGEGDNVMPDVEDIYGGAGNDTLVGDDQRNLIGGQAGDDTIDGGGDDDVVNGGEGADKISGGAGRDIVNYAWETAPISVSYDGNANDGADGEGDNVAADVEGVVGGSDADALLGGPGPDFLYGYGGGDQIFGGPAEDMIVAGDGDDYVEAMDGAADFVSCGDGADTALVDATDNVAADCETKIVGTAAQITTPGAIVRAVGATVTVPVTCQALLADPCTGTVRLSAKVPVVAKPKAKKKTQAHASRHKRRHKHKRRHRAKPKAKTVDLGSASYTAAPGATTQVTIALTRDGAAALAKLRKLSVKAKATSTDRAGGVSTATQSFVLAAQPRPAAKRPAPKRPAGS